jgi:hypothetical protein
VVVLFDAIDEEGIESDGDLLLQTRILAREQLLLLSNAFLRNLLAAVDLLQGFEVPLVDVQAVLVSVVVEQLLEVVLGGLGGDRKSVVLEG